MLWSPPFDRPAFAKAREELEALGVVLSDRPFVGSSPYAVVDGRANPRWWLIPLADRRTTVSGLALLQPAVPSARILKAASVLATSAGLSRLWARHQIHVGSTSALDELFGRRGLAYAFFTGTQSPHRKLAIQAMEPSGEIRGYAKVTLSPMVAALLAHEAAMLERVAHIPLSSTLTPRTLFYGSRGAATVLVTDTLKSARTRTVTSLSEQHMAFVRDMAEGSATPISERPGSVVRTLRDQTARLSARLPPAWLYRLEAAVEMIEPLVDSVGPRGLSHGDFTPWNTFLVADKLYVFDWEYASYGRAPGYDPLYFYFALPSNRQAPSDRIRGATACLRRCFPGLTTEEAHGLLAAFLCDRALFYAARDLMDDPRANTWADERSTAELIDSALLRGSP